MNTNEFQFVVDTSSIDDLNERASRMTPNKSPISLTPLEQSVHFLRGVGSRASLCIPAFYCFIGSLAAQEKIAIKDNYPKLVFASYMEFASINTLTLSCRKVFDDDPKKLTGSKFSRISDEILHKHADYWAKSSKRPIEEAVSALTFLRKLFKLCSQQQSAMLKSNSLLQKRIGLLKQHANRSAAHLSLDDYAIHLDDLAHFTAALCLIGEIIRSFDSTYNGESYFNDIDKSSHKAAVELFPAMEIPRLFSNSNIKLDAKNCWSLDSEAGIQQLLNQLPFVIGWF